PFICFEKAKAICHLQKHQSACLLKEVQCSNPGCAEKLPQQDMSVHVAFECSWRRINCEYCQESVLSHKKQKHFDVCQKFPVQCTNECGVREIPRDKLEVHIRDQCPEAAVTCEYENLGCKAMFPRSNTDSHSKSEVEGHLRLALHCLEATRLQVHDLVSLVKEQSQQIERLMSKKLEIANDPFVWKVPHFHALLGKAKTGVKQVLLSESFSLWKNGYMLRIKMMLEKFSEWGSVFLSLSIVNVPGEFDKSLSWPFVEKIHVAIIDQNPCKEESDNMSHVIDFGHKRDRATFKALTITGDCEFGTIFASANELYNRSYIVNDAVLITASTEEDKVQPS
ncbi:unnamed protein product, partial [Pocillopora meandrina]